MCLLLTELRGVVNQHFSPLVVLEDLNTCPARLGTNKKNRTACAGRDSFTQSPAVMYSSSRGLQQYNGMRRQIFLYPVPSRNVLFFAWLTTVPSKITAIADIERLSFGLVGLLGIRVHL